MALAFQPRRDLFPPFNPLAPQPDDSLQSPQGSNLTQLNFAPQSPQSAGDSSQQPVTPPATQDDYASRLKALLDSPSPATKAYGDYLKTYPTKQAPNFTTSLAAALSGAGAGWKNPAEGGLVAQQMLDQPRVKALQDWSSKAGALKEGADLEDKDLKGKLGVLKEVDTTQRNSAKDSDEAALHAAQVKNYNSLIQERQAGKTELKEDATTGHLISFNKDTGERKDLGVVALTPQQKADLQVSTSAQEEDHRQQNRKDLFNFTDPKLTSREKNVHEANRVFDVNNPMPRTGGLANGFESIDQQNKAISSAAKELNIESGGNYSDLMDPTTGALKNPDDLKGGVFSDDKTQALKDFYALAQARAQQKLATTRTRTQSSATTYPPVKPPTVDPRIQQ